MKITSPTNPKIKELVKLRDHRARAQSGLTLIDGIREVRGSIEAGVLITEVYLCPELYEKQSRGNVEETIIKPLNAKKVSIYEVTEEVFQKIAFGDRLEGVIAVGKPQHKKLPDIKVTSKSFFMIAENIEKPGNLGAILRTCDAVGMDALFVSDPATDIFNPNVIRASVGTVFSMPIIQATADEIKAFLQKSGVRIFATTPSAKTIYTSADFKGKIAIVVGSEKEGLSDFWFKAADEKIVIPMKGQADSLNTSVAAALVAYEALRQRGL